MHKKIISLIIILSFFACKNSMQSSNGEFNEIVIVSSIEDKKLLEPIVNDYIFDNIIHTPEPEYLYKKIWIKPEGFKYYKKYSNIIIISISNPIDQSIDKLMIDFKNKYNIENFPITLNDIYSKPQMITFINDSNDISIKSNLNKSVNMIKSSIESHIDSLYLFRYKNIFKSTYSKEISNISDSLFSIKLLLDTNFKFIKQENDLLWIGKGSITYDSNALYQWLIFKDINYFEINGNLEFQNIIKDQLTQIDTNLELITNFNKFSINTYNNKIVYKLNSLYNHNLYKTGGPIISYIINDKETNKAILIYGLINAPGNSKIELIKELETIIINSIF